LFKLDHTRGYQLSLSDSKLTRSLIILEVWNVA
jgi:hypothetical protein